MSSAATRIVIKSPREIEQMRSAGQLVRSILNALSADVAPGVTTALLNEKARQMIEDAGATALFLGVENPQARFPFPGCICSSVNEEVVHGIPNDRPLKEGDIVSIDCGVRLKGYCGDAAVTVPVGRITAETQRLLDVTQEALNAAVREIRPFRRWSDVARVMQEIVESAGFGVVREFVGHGIGREMHEEPKVPNYVDRSRRGDFQLVPGMTLAVEPMVTVGRPEVVFADRDRWTVVTKDRRWAAHFENTIAVTERGADVLTSSA